jgi:hypothetical protein
MFQFTDQFVDRLQTVVLLVLALGVIYPINLLRAALKEAAELLRDVSKTQGQLHENVRRVWERIDALETRQGIKGDVDTFIRMKRLLDVLERPPSQPPRPPDTST